MTLLDDRWRYVAGPYLSVKMTAGAAVKAGAPVKISSAKVIEVAAAGDPVFGIAEHDAATDASVSVFCGWGAVVEAEVVASGDTLAVGDLVWAAAPVANAHYVVKDSGTGNPAANKIACGIVIVGAAAGAKAQFLFMPTLGFNVATGVITLSA